MPRAPTGHLRLHHVLLTSAVVASVVVSHAVVYATEYPDARTRNAHLMATGHGYWPLAVMLGSAAALVALLAAATAGVVHVDVVPELRPFIATASVAYGLLETGERIAAHVPVVDLVPGGELAVGVVAQIATALLVALVLRWVAHVAARVMVVPAGSPVPRRPHHIFAERHNLVRRRGRGPAAARAPPTAGPSNAWCTRRMETGLCDAS